MPRPEPHENDVTPLREQRRAAWSAVLDAGASDTFARREFLRRMGAAMALAGLGACTRAPERKILPYVEQPPEVRPGVAVRYATALEIDGYGRGLLVESHEGRPTKIEGNPAHPASLGASSAIEQAAVLSLYDPTRLASVRHRREPASWPQFDAALRAGRWRGARGRGLHLVLPPTASPTVAALLERLRARYPEARVHAHAPWGDRGANEAARVAFGRPLARRLALARADVIVTLDDDLLSQGPAAHPNARAWADRRRDPIAAPMNRLYAVESQVTPTGMAADHRLPVRHGDVAAVAARLVAELAPPELAPLAERWKGAAAPHERWVAALARDLGAHRGRSVIAAGPSQPVTVHLLADALNAALGNFERTVDTAPMPADEPALATHALPELVEALRAGDVEHLVVVGSDLRYAAPADVPLADLLERAGASFYVGAHADATAQGSTWAAPLAHPLESWGDTRAFDGTAAIVQPLIAPLRPGRTPATVLASLLGDDPADGYAIVRAVWSARWGITGAAFERRWEDALASGVVPNTTIAVTPTPIAWERVRAALAGLAAPPPTGADAPLELTFPRDARMHDGHMISNAWLLELPDPVTKLTWENAAHVAPATARRLHLETGDPIELTLRGRRLTCAAVVVPGHPDGSIALATGWGRSVEGAPTSLGVNAYRLASADAWHADAGLEIRRVGARRELPRTQRHHHFPSHEHAHAVFRRVDRAELLERPPPAGKRRLPQLYHRTPPRREQWAMTIDLGLCTGCNACVLACQAENNVPTVGAEGVAKARAMHWLRVDTYASDHGGDGDAYAPQPMLCQHCEMAPCEYVCPTNATVHSDDGLNEMVYNRCVGTRFCSNNCPYKVRRFNWFDAHHDEPAVLALARNPDVTVRARGVMEKCSFCVQRIRESGARARAEGRRVEDGEVQTACQQACPTRAIVFGDGNDPRAEVARRTRDPRAYEALDELGTHPRVRYLERVRNRNEEIA